MIDLYPNFKHLLKYDNIWLYSDPHFNDPDSEFFRKTYIGDEEQVKSINSKVGKNDVIIFLGDIGDISFISKIRGYKILVMGNHDSGKSNYERVLGEKDNKLFDEVYSGPVILNDKVILSHEPINIPFMFNIHGHDHSNCEGFKDDLHLNVCAELINYIPISFKTLIKKGKFSKVPNIHRIAIDKQIQRKNSEK